MDKMVIKINWSEDLDLYCSRIAKEYNVNIIQNPDHFLGRILITGQARNIQALIIDGQFSEYTDDDLEVEYDKQHNVDPAWRGNWDW